MKVAVQILLVLLGCCLVGCAPSSENGENKDASSLGQGGIQAEATPAESWWEGIETLCGRAFSGALVSDDPADEDLAGQPMVMHVRRCEPERIEIPFHIGTDRSRTWLLTRKGARIQLQHDHRHEDGSEDAVTLYGGLTQEDGSSTVQSFPADDYSKDLFAVEGLEASSVNVWSMELIPGERFSYILRRPGRHFRADFDLTNESAAPPAPWGHE